MGPARTARRRGALQRKRQPVHRSRASTNKRRWALILILAIGLAGLGPSETQTSEPPRSSSKVAPSIQELSRRVLMPSVERSRRASMARSVRARLSELGAALDALARDPSSDGVKEVLARRSEAGVAVISLRGSRFRKGGRLPKTIDQRLNQLWSDVDAAAADPIGQRPRLDAARQQIRAALAERHSERVITSTVSTIQPTKGGR